MQFESIGNVDKFALLRQINDTIFDSKKDSFKYRGRIFTVRKYSGGDVRGITVDGILYIEQNTKSGSTSALRAASGAKILWVIRGSRYIGQVINGEGFAVPTIALRVYRGEKTQQAAA